MYVWDNAHEGDYKKYGSNDAPYYPADGKCKWFNILANSHWAARDCGIPDGGRSADKDRVRVIFKAATPTQAPSQGDPGRGLRINRVAAGDGEQDSLLFRNHATGETIAEAKFPNIMHQRMNLTINGTGAHLNVFDSTASTESQVQAAMVVVAEVMKTMAEIFLTVMEFAA